MPESYYAFEIEVAETQRDLLNAMLLDVFESFEMTEKGFIGYLPQGTEPQGVATHLSRLKEQVDFTFALREIPETNWNALWESNFDPVEVEDFCRIYADFHLPKGGFEHSIRINPEMAFGTGHHETTYLMILAMSQLSVSGRIWDFGTGTGILAILARKMGAAPGIIANDIEAPAIRNAHENMQINQVDGIDFRLGGTEIVPEEGFDLILANINRNVILSHLHALHQKLNPKGNVLFSGILKNDYDNTLLPKCQSTGLTEKMYLEKNNWVCALFQRS